MIDRTLNSIQVAARCTSVSSLMSGCLFHWIRHNVNVDPTPKLRPPRSICQCLGTLLLSKGCVVVACESKKNKGPVTSRSMVRRIIVLGDLKEDEVTGLVHPRRIF